jgi:hypothetical protein
MANIYPHPDSVANNTRITSADFGDYHYQQFLNWTFCDRQSKAALIRNLAVARTDANTELISGKLEYYTELYGLTMAELQKRIFEADAEGISVAELHRRLTAEAEQKRAQSE